MALLGFRTMAYLYNTFLKTDNSNWKIKMF